MTSVGSVVSLWRYPVKSMLGEELDNADIIERGFTGDRAYAIIDQQTGKVASAKHPRKWGRLLACRASYRSGLPACDSSTPVQITLPNGTVVHSGQDNINELLSSEFGYQITMAAKRPEKPSVENVDPFAEIETVTDIGAFMLRDGFADYAPIHLLTTASLERLRKLNPQGQFDVRRYRPNMVVNAVSEGEGFIENSWVGQTLSIGDEVRLHITDPAPRCIMTTLAQDDLPHDLDILRTVAQHNQVGVPALGGRVRACVGVYAFVLKAGKIRCGDPVRIEQPAGG